jgi:hypothetical protein
MKVTVRKNAEYVNLGDWITYFTFCFDGDNFEIKKVITRSFMIFNIFCRSNFLKVGDILKTVIKVMLPPKTTALQYPLV